MANLLSDRAKIVPLLAVAVVIALGSTLVILLTHRSTGMSSSPAVSSTAGPGAAGKTVKLSIASYLFVPATVNVAVGTTVAWTNRDSTEHTATGSGSSFDTGTIAGGQTKTFAFKKPGTYQYICSFHPFMHASIVVK